MRLPFTQVAIEIIDVAAPDLAALLDWDEAKAGWGLIKLHKWALERCPEGELPSAHAIISGPAAAKLIARAAGWSGLPEAFAKACEEVRPAVLETVEGGIRVRGLDRYDVAVANAEGRSGKAQKAADARWSKHKQCSNDAPPMLEACSADAPAMLHDAKTEIKTQTKKLLPSEVVRPPAAEKVPVVVVAPEAPVESWDAFDFWRWAQAGRQSNKLLAEKQMHPAKLSAWFSTALMTEGVSIRALRDGFVRFGNDPHWEKASPPYPFAAFVSQWTKYVRQEEPTHAATP